MKFIDKPLAPFGDTILEMTVPTNLTFKTPLVFRMVRELVGRGYLPSTGDARAELALDEAITNAMLHGNKLDPARKVHVRLFGDKEKWGAIIADEGDGFTAADIPRLDDPETLTRETGRGIMLMDGYVDELLYNARGNAVMLQRHRQAKADVLQMEAARAAAVAEAEAPPVAEPATLAEHGAVAVVAVHVPRITEDNLDAIKEVLDEAVLECKGLIIDLGRTSYITSKVIGALMSVYRHLRAQSGALILADVQPAVASILQSVALDRILEFAPDCDAALAHLQERFPA